MNPAVQPKPVKPRWARYGLNLFMVIGSCAFALVLAEAAVRVAGIGSDQFLRPDPVLGVRFIASKTGLSQGACYKARVAINAQGWRSREVGPAKPEGVYRVLVLGDSFMAGLQVEDDETFSSVLERQLGRELAPRRVEVINFGVPSWGTDQQYLSLRNHGLELKPDLVLLAFYGQNDISDNYSLLISAKSTYPKPFFDIDDGQLVAVPFVDPTPRLIAIGRELAAHSRLYPLVRDSLLELPIAHRLLYKLGVVGVVPMEDKQSAGSPAAGNWRWPHRWKRQVGVYERDDDWSYRIHAWSITERLLDHIRDDVERAGASFLLIELSSPIAIMPPSLLRELTSDRPEQPLDADKPSRLIGKIARDDRIDLVSLVPGFRARIGDSEAEFEKYYLRCDGHWTPAGHRLAAELAAAEITARIAKRPAR